MLLSPHHKLSNYNIKVVTDGVCFLSVVYVSQRDVIDNETIISQYYLTPT